MPLYRIVVRNDQSRYAEVVLDEKDYDTAEEKAVHRALTGEVEWTANEAVDRVEVVHSELLENRDE